MLQRGFGGRYVQRLVRIDGGVRRGAAQRAGLAGLQGVAVLVQALDAALLLQQLALVGHLFLEGVVLRAQGLACGVANSEDNARSLNQTIPVVAAFRATVVPHTTPMPADLIDIGYNDYLNNQRAVIFIEWGDLFPLMIPKNKIEINKHILSSFFLRSGRFPYFSIKNSLILTSYGQDNFLNESFPKVLV